MEVAARLKGARISAQKARLVADQIRGKGVEEALDLLTFSPKKAASILKKVLNSAIANAEHNEGADVDELRVSTIFCRRRHDYEASSSPCKRPGRSHSQAVLPYHDQSSRRRRLVGETKWVRKYTRPASGWES